MANYTELDMDQGADFGAVIELRSPLTNNPSQLNAISFSCQMRRSMLSQNVSANLVCSVYDASRGEISVSLDAANTSTLKAGTYVFDVMMTAGPFMAVKVVEGIITVNPTITR